MTNLLGAGSDISKADALALVGALEDKLEAKDTKIKSMAGRVAPLAPVASGGLAVATAYSVAFLEGAKVDPASGKDDRKGLVALPLAVAGGVGALAFGKAHPILRGASEAVGVGASCAFVALAGHEHGVKARLEWEKRRMTAKRAEAAAKAVEDGAAAKA